MKALFVIALFFCLESSAQDSLQQARLKTLQGKILPFSAIAKNDSLILICFWSSSSEESITELNSINTNLSKWMDAKNFRFMAVSTDEGKLANKLRPLYNMNGWTFEAYVDIYGELRKALHSNNLPQSYIVYRGRILYEQTGWTEGSENYLIQRILSVKN